MSFGLLLLYQLRQLRSLSDDANKPSVQSFVSCRPDYCNALLYGISRGLIQRRRSVQNAAARLVTGAPRRDHITPVLRSRTWDVDISGRVFRRLHVCRPTDTVTDRRQEFLCSRTAAMEQPTDRDPGKRHYTRTL